MKCMVNDSKTLPDRGLSLGQGLFKTSYMIFETYQFPLKRQPRYHNQDVTETYTLAFKCIKVEDSR